jgi:hypothetical protein
MLGLVLGHCRKESSGIVAAGAAELGGKHLVAVARLHLDQLREIEGVHNAELGQVKTGGH